MIVIYMSSGSSSIDSTRNKKRKRSRKKSSTISEQASLNELEGVNNDNNNTLVVGPFKRKRKRTKKSNDNEIKKSMDKKTTICIGTLYEIYNNYLSLTHEVCGNLFMSPQYCLRQDDIVYGPPISDNGMCQNKHYSPYIFHTHPEKTNYYPSFEDLVKVCKKVDKMKTIVNGKEEVIAGKIQNSLIFTPIGIWNLSSEGVIEDTQDFVKRNKKGYTDSKIECDLHKALKTKQKNWVDVLNEYIKRVEKYFRGVKMNIRFDPWDLSKSYVI
jgi:hypothetical protein